MIKLMHSERLQPVQPASNNIESGVNNQEPYNNKKHKVHLEEKGQGGKRPLVHDDESSACFIKGYN